MVLSRRSLVCALITAPGALAASLVGPLSSVAHAQTPFQAAFADLVARGAEARALKSEIYDPAYVPIAYPMGDVPDDRGVCADTIIRAFRAAGIDLQQQVHEDMRAAFSAYPTRWGLKRPDPNIDHRRVPNLEAFFTRAGAARTLDDDATLFEPGDVVSWRLPGNLPHIGIVSTKVSPAGRPLVVHNIGWGSQIEDVLFAWRQTGWFRYRPGV